MTDDISAAPQRAAMPGATAAGMPRTAAAPGATAAGMPRSAAAATARRQPYSDGKRLAYGLLWAGWTVVLTIAGFGLLFGGQVLAGLVALALAALAGRYDYRIWTWRARRLLFFLIF